MSRKTKIYGGAVGATCMFAIAYALAFPANIAAPPAVTVIDAPTALNAPPPATAPVATAAAEAPSAAPAALGDFSDVDAKFQSSAIVNGVLIIGNAQGIVHEVTKGTFNADLAYPIASSSKLLTGTLVMRMIQAGKLNLADHPAPTLGYWTNDPSDSRSAVTVQQMLSLTSGFNATPTDVTCVNNPAFTLQSCAQSIYSLGLDTNPGSSFSYGPQHLEEAAALAATAGGKSFDALFAEYITTPLNMTCTRFVESAASAATHLSGRACNASYLANTNTWAAGGAVSSAHDYSKLLQAFVAGGFITDPDGFFQPRTLGLARGYVPASVDGNAWQYALGSWNECNKPAWDQECAEAKVNSAPGAYGWLPWIDRKHGYYALIATRIAVGEGDTKSVPIERQLQQPILTALGY